MKSTQMRTGRKVELDPESRTYRANLVRMQRAEERAAEHLRGRGWICLPPGTPVHAGGLVNVPLPLEDS